MAHLANFHQGVTTVAFYDTLGVNASLHMWDQTELTTMAVSIEYVSKLAKIKIDDAQDKKKMHRVKNIICFENVIDDKEHQKDRELAETAGL